MQTKGLKGKKNNYIIIMGILALLLCLTMLSACGNDKKPEKKAEDNSKIVIGEHYFLNGDKEEGSILFRDKEMVALYGPNSEGEPKYVKYTIKDSTISIKMDQETLDLKIISKDKLESAEGDTFTLSQDKKEKK